MLSSFRLVNGGVFQPASSHEVRAGFFQDRNLFDFVGKLALKSGIFLAELALAVADGLLVCRLCPPLIHLLGVQAELAGRGGTPMRSASGSALAQYPVL